MEKENKNSICNICKVKATDIHIEICETDTGIPCNEDVYVCENCLEKAKKNFLFYCVQCGASYERDKQVVIDRAPSPEEREAYMAVANVQMVMGIKGCIQCAKEEIVNEYLNNQLRQGDFGHA